MPLNRMNLTLSEADNLIQHAKIVASSMGLSICIVVVDSGGRTIGSAMMDGAKFTSMSIAQGKAATAAGHKSFTSKLATGRNRGIENSNNGMFTVFAGGVPVQFQGEIIGAIGISGGKPTEDEAICVKAIEAVKPTFVVLSKL